MAKFKVLTSAFACAPGGGNERLGGGELILGWNVVRQLARCHEVWVLTHSENRDAIERGLQPGDACRLHFHYLRLPGLLERLTRVQGGIQLYAYVWQVRAYFLARRLHREVRFDVFHHVTYANDWMASYIGALLPVPYLRGPGGGSHRTPPAFLKEYSFSARLWERFRVFGQWVLRHDPVYVRGQRRARALLLCNREAADAVPRRLKSKVQLFPVNGFSEEDLRIFAGDSPGSAGTRGNDGGPMGGSPSEAGGAANAGRAAAHARFEVLSAGKLLGLKAYPLAIRAFARFAERHPGVHFTIVGEGPERPRLEKLVRDLALEKRVQLTRWMPRHDLLVMMRQCDTFLFPSLRDGGGAVVVEAMAAGKPVICMDLAGPGLHITEECGIKLPARSPGEVVELMAQALERLYQDKGLRERMGQAGRSRAERSYSWDRLGERLLKIYEEVLGVSFEV
jgi:glycosyltransferase involved in cell wall biosynthesis